ncbi:hypothetical protein Curi_c16550 [Gottschalkia acidurici 9a]|uniref:Uncharacterized protein n=1 Tax=Gottschalkia acidurici (strain ATCC 7906 / DSM 604 / BCRC 14475 / CIP 104303 / KCTC 5404 / NCIMB 10678 / 9a) TaxID=1128398 RepID=K0B0Q7_GOTA9|nr:hypothetical protein [Gottschalkia acidurici]AFS78662.1 hypothetical protein Curi_c16550 [Gottschalkia acidurici 9a]
MNIILSEDNTYTANKDLLAFKKAGGTEAGLHDMDLFYYEVETKEQYTIGDQVNFRNKEMYISEIKAPKALRNKSTR